MMALRPRLLSSAATWLDHAGMLNAVSHMAGWAARSDAFQVLTYHRVNDAGDPFFPAIPTGVFEAQMRHISLTHAVLPVEDLVEQAARGRIPRNALAITFDDGYRDNLTNAAPVLARYALRATIFLATAYIGSRQRPWYEEIALAFKTTTATHITAPWGREWRLAQLADRLSALDECWAHLRAVPESDFDDTVARVLEALGAARGPVDGASGNGMLDWADVKGLHGLGFTIGAHTMTHPMLSRVTSGRARTEIVGSRDAIADMTGRVPRAFAYPNGTAADYTPEVVDLVRRAGFTCAVTTRFGINTAKTSPWELRRGGPWEYHVPTFALKLAGYRLLRSE